MNKLSDFTDGLSKTILVGEHLLGDGDTASVSPFDQRTDIARGGTWDWAGAGLSADAAHVITKAQLDSFGQDCLPKGAANHSSRMGMRWARPAPTMTLFNTLAPPNWRFPSCMTGSSQSYADIHGVYSARSNHPSGAVHVFADGSVTTTQGEVDLQAYHGFGTRNGGEAGATP